ncbi:MAG: SpoIIE family protein phosphatase, partial [Oligoflexales bacterium]|nr:SpoIIE family protein phosphatase [Oligoflexales bacterium]
MNLNISIVILMLSFLFGKAFSKELIYDEKTQYDNIYDYLEMMDIDSPHQKTIPDIVDLDREGVRKSPDIPNLKIFDRPLWIRLSIRNPYFEKKELILEQRAEFKFFKVFERDEKGVYAMALPKPSFRFVEPSYKINLYPGENIFYVHMETYIFTSMFLSLKTPYESNSATMTAFIAKWVVNGTIAMICLYSLVLFFYFKTVLHLLFIGQMVCFMCYNQVLSGFFVLKDIPNLFSIGYSNETGFTCSMPILPFYLTVLITMFAVIINNVILNFKDESKNLLLQSKINIIIQIFLLIQGFYSSKINVLLTSVSILAVFSLMAGTFYFIITKKRLYSFFLILSVFPIILSEIGLFGSVFMGYRPSIFVFHIVYAISSQIEAITILTLSIFMIRDNRIATDEARFKEETAKALQRSLIPNEKTFSAHCKLPEGLDVQFCYESADTTGGDLLGFVYNEKSRILLSYICDVTGHGLSSAIVTGILSGIINTHPDLEKISDEKSIEKFLHTLIQDINNIIAGTGAVVGRFCSIAVIAIPVDRDFGYMANAGHPPPVLKIQDRISTIPSL